MVSVSAFILGPVHSDICIPGESISVFSVIGEDRNADTGSDRDFKAVKFEGLMKRMEDAFSHIYGHFCSRNVREKEHKFVPAEPGDGVALAEHVNQPVSHAPEESVADVMTPSVIHLFEFV
jgi:hypothetical protein